MSLYTGIGNTCVYIFSLIFKQPLRLRFIEEEMETINCRKSVSATEREDNSKYDGNSKPQWFISVEIEIALL